MDKRGLGNFSYFFVQNQLFQKIVSGTLSECQKVWMPDPNCLQRLSTDIKFTI